MQQSVAVVKEVSEAPCPSAAPVQHARGGEQHQAVVPRRDVHRRSREREQPERAAIAGLPPCRGLQGAVTHAAVDV